MSLRAHKFTAAGQVVPADEADTVSGVVVVGFTSVTVHNGTDATGDPVLVANGPGSVFSPQPIHCDKGIYVETAGAGSGSVLE